MYEIQVGYNEYPVVAQATDHRAILQHGEAVNFGHLNGDQHLLFIFCENSFSKIGAGVVDPGPSAISLGVWSQSNQESHQNVLGNWAADAKLTFSSTPDEFNIITVNNDTLDVASVAFGLARAQQEEFNISGSPVLPAINHYLSAWPVRRNGTFLCDLRVGAYEIFTEGDLTRGDLAWSKTIVCGLDWPMSDVVRNLAKFFYGNVGRWVSFIPHPTVATPAMYSMKQDRTTVYPSVTTNLTKPAFGASVHNFIRNSSTLSLNLALPYTDASTPGTYPSIEILHQDDLSGEWTSAATVAVSGTVIGSEYTIIENGHSLSSPVAWWNDGFFTFASGVTSSGSACAWAYLKIDYAGAQGVGCNQSFGAGAPGQMTEFFFDDEATDTGVYSSAGYDSSPHGGGVSPRWINPTATRGTDPSFADWDGVCPIQLPAETANTARFGTLSQHLHSVWPLARKNSLNSVIDGNHAWFVILVPEQWEVGGHYTSTITMNAVETWEWSYQDYNLCIPANSLSNGYVRVDSHPGPPPGEGLSTGSSPLTVTTDCINGPAVYPPGETRVGGRRQEWTITNIGMKPEEVGEWVHDQIFIYKTLLVAMNLTTGSYFTTDITQKFTVGHNVSLGQEGGTPSTTQSRDNVNGNDNVWQWISLPDKQCLAVLRDRHADDPDKNPSPCIEIYDYSGGYTDMPVIATIPLGTQDLFVEGSGDILTGEEGISYSESDSVGGDQVTFVLPTTPGVTITGIVSVLLNNDEGTPAGYTYTAPDQLVLDDPLINPDYIQVTYSIEYEAPLPSGSQYGDRIWDPYALGAPRMKATSKITEDGVSHPVIMAAVWETKKVDNTIQSEFRKAVYHKIDLEVPATPVETSYSITSADPGVGNGVSNPAGNAPLWDDWDSLVIAGGTMSWIRDSKLREVV